MSRRNKKENKIELASIFNSNSMHLFTMLCGYFLLILFLYSIFQIIRIVNLNFINIISIISPIIMYLIISKNKSIKTQIIIISIFLFLLLILPFVYNKTFDLTVDGNTYHKSSIAYIKNGWNPLYETARDFQKKENKVIGFEENERIDLWMEHYPKATWIIAAVMYNYTGNIESGKCLTIILDIMLIIITYNCLAKILDKKWSIILTGLVAINPITLVQLYTFYVDGIMGILFAIELLLLLNINPKEKINIITWMCLATVASIMVNIKFTGLVCSGIVAAVYYFYWLIVNRKDKNILNIFKKITIPFVIVYVIAIFLVGSNSYVKNTIDHHNPMYPLMGKGKVDIITTMQPKSFNNKTKIEKFIISIFSKSENVTYEMEPTIKFPLRVYRKELDIVEIPDARIGGFGPLFATVMIVSIVVLISGLCKLYKYDKEKINKFILPIISILLSMILVGESWWARYIPQLYLIPLLSIILVIYERNTYKKRIIPSLLCKTLSAIIILNSLFFFYGNYHSIKSNINISKDIKEIKKMNNVVLRTSRNDSYGYYYTLNDNNLRYEIDKNIKEEDSIYKYSWRVMVKKDEELSETN